MLYVNGFQPLFLGLLINSVNVMRRVNTRSEGQGILTLTQER
jgi:hypothetical protein